MTAVFKFEGPRPMLDLGTPKRARATMAAMQNVYGRESNNFDQFLQELDELWETRAWLVERFGREWAIELHEAIAKAVREKAAVELEIGARDEKAKAPAIVDLRAAIDQAFLEILWMERCADSLSKRAIELEEEAEAGEDWDAVDFVEPPLYRAQREAQIYRAQVATLREARARLERLLGLDTDEVQR